MGFDRANTIFRSIDKSCAIPLLRANKASIGENCDIETPLYFHNCSDYSNLIIGNNCHIGKNCFFDLKSKVRIGNNVVISMQATFITHLDMSKSALSRIYPNQSADIIIEDDCYIGANSTLLYNVKLGKCSLVAACSLVRTSFDEYSVITGIPAVLKKLSVTGN